MQSPAAKKGPPARAGQGTFSGYSQGKAGGDDSECSNVSFDIRCESHHVFGLNRVLQVWSYRTLVYQLRLRNQGRRDGQTDLYEERQKEVLVSLPSLSVNSTTYEKRLNVTSTLIHSIFDFVLDPAMQYFYLVSYIQQR